MVELKAFYRKALIVTTYIFLRAFYVISKKAVVVVVRATQD